MHSTKTGVARNDGIHYPENCSGPSRNFRSMRAYDRNLICAKLGSAQPFVNFTSNGSTADEATKPSTQEDGNFGGEAAIDGF
jgi:hypothetical protein